jgi:MFS family permease
MKATPSAAFCPSDISIALPTIGKEFGGSMDSLQWAVNGYFLTGSLIIVGGKLGDLIGRRKLFLIGSGLLIAGSVVAMTASATPQHWPTPATPKSTAIGSGKGAEWRR